MKYNLKSNLRYKQLLITNLVLMILPSIIFIIVILTKSFDGDNGRLTTLIVLTVFIILIIINTSLLLSLRKYNKNNKSLPKILKIISFTIAIPAIVGMLVRNPKYLKDLFENNCGENYY